MIETSSPGSASDRESERSESRAARQAHGGAPWSEEELRSWAEDWTADDGDSGGRTGEPFAAAERAVAKGERQRILRRARAWSLWQWLMVVFEYAVGIGALVWSFAMARVERSPSAWALFAILILLVGSAFVVTAWNRRGTWRPENTSTRAFLELEILREERKIYTAAWLLPGFFVFEVVLLLPWLLWHHSGDPATGIPPRACSDPSSFSPSPPSPSSVVVPSMPGALDIVCKISSGCTTSSTAPRMG